MIEKMKNSIGLGYTWEVIDPDQIIHSFIKTYKPIGNDVNIYFRPLSNITNHTRFITLLKDKKNFVFDGTGADKNNTWNRVVIPCRASGYLVTMVLVKCPLKNLFKRVCNRFEKNNREVPVGVIKNTFFGLQRSIPEYKELIKEVNLRESNRIEVKFFDNSLENIIEIQEANKEEIYNNNWNDWMFSSEDLRDISSIEAQDSCDAAKYLDNA